VANVRTVQRRFRRDRFRELRRTDRSARRVRAGGMSSSEFNQRRFRRMHWESELIHFGE
jgi:hypothetical protein